MNWTLLLSSKRWETVLKSSMDNHAVFFRNKEENTWCRVYVKIQLLCVPRIKVIVNQGSRNIFDFCMFFEVKFTDSTTICCRSFCIRPLISGIFKYNCSSSPWNFFLSRLAWFETLCTRKWLFWEAFSVRKWGTGKIKPWGFFLHKEE